MLYLLWVLDVSIPGGPGTMWRRTGRPSGQQWTQPCPPTPQLGHSSQDTADRWSCGDNPLASWALSALAVSTPGHRVMRLWSLILGERWPQLLSSRQGSVLLPDEALHGSQTTLPPPGWPRLWDYDFLQLLCSSGLHAHLWENTHLLC